MKNKKQIFIGIILTVIIAISIVVIFLNYKNQHIDHGVFIENEGDIILGDDSALKNLIVYFDYNCKYCKQFFNEVYPLLKKNLIDEGDLKLTLRLVCSGNDERALLANQTVICINKYGDFEKLHALLMHRSEIMYTNHFEQLVEDYIMDNDFVGSCIYDGEQNDVIRNIFQFQSLKTKGTPTFVIGNKLIVGFKDYENLKKIIL